MPQDSHAGLTTSGSPTNGYAHWRLDREPDGIAWLTLDRAGSTTNTFSADVLAEFGRILDTLAVTPPRGLVLRSGKASGFAAGADVEEFKRVQTVEEALVIVRRGWDTYNKLAQAPYPTLALVKGFAMGGGLEVILACRYRVAIDDPSTRFALPEVMLGILPGWGGVQRLPKIIGPSAALDMMLTGKSIDAKRARKMGLVDATVAERVQENTARMMLAQAKPARTLGWKDRLMLGPLRKIVAATARKQVATRARREHYPAPYAIIDLFEKYDGDPFAPSASDPASIASLLGHPTTKNLIRVFGLQDRMKALGKHSNFAAKHVHVIGAGVMGGDIAAWCALRGMIVTLQDQDPARLAPAMQRAQALFERRLRGERLAQRDALDRLIPDVAGNGVKKADVIIEAIVENLAVKQDLFAHIEVNARPEAILATNTSSLNLTDISTKMHSPARLIGLHFFNPVAQMQLVEVVESAITDQAQAHAGAAFARQLDKLPLLVADSPGFLVNRVLGPYLANAIRMLDEGVQAETIDAAAVRFGMPMGPIELADVVGLDVCAAAGKALAGDSAPPPATLAALLVAGKFGKKSGQGFYRWDADKAVKASASGTIDEAFTARIVTPYLEEAKKVVAEKVVADADLADAGLIFGTGFAPFEGGPLHYLATHGE